MTNLEQRNAHVHPVMADILNGFTAIPDMLALADLDTAPDDHSERVRYSLESHFITWGPLGYFSTLEQAKTALAMWRNDTSRPLRIVREGVQVVYSDPLPEYA